jgi:hypothetical protein
VLPPGGPAAFLVAEPVDDGFRPIADVPAEPDVREEPAASVLADPALRDSEELGDLGGGEETVAHGVLRAESGTRSRYKIGAAGTRSSYPCGPAPDVLRFLDLVTVTPRRLLKVGLRLRVGGDGDDELERGQVRAADPGGAGARPRAVDD